MKRGVQHISAFETPKRPCPRRRRLAALCLAAALSVSLAGCGSRTSRQASSSQSLSSAQQTSPRVSVQTPSFSSGSSVPSGASGSSGNSSLASGAGTGTLPSSLGSSDVSGAALSAAADATESAAEDGSLESTISPEASSDSSSDTTSSEEDAGFLLTSVDAMDAVLESNPLNASRTYLRKKAAITGTVTDIDSGGDYLLLSPGGDTDAKPIVCTISSYLQTEAASELVIGDTLTVCGTVSSVDTSSGYTVETAYLKRGFSIGDEGRYEGYIETRIDMDHVIDLPKVWIDNAEVYLQVTDDYMILQLVHEGSDTAISYAVQFMAISVTEPIEDLRDMEDELSSYFGDGIEVSSISWDSVNSIQRARITAKSDDETNRTDFYAESGGTVLYCLTLDDWSGDSAQIADNRALFLNASESMRESGTAFSSSRDYTNWTRQTITDGYTIMIPNTWTRVSDSAVSWQDSADAVYCIREDTNGNIMDAMVIQHRDLTDAVNGNEEMAGSTLEAYLRSDYRSGGTFITSFAAGIISDPDSTEEAVPQNVSCDSVNGCFRIKIERDPSLGSIKRTDVVVDDNLIIILDFDSFAYDYSGSLGVFTKAVRSVNISDTAMMIRAGEGGSKEDDTSLDTADSDTGSSRAPAVSDTSSSEESSESTVFTEESTGAAQDAGTAGSGESSEEDAASSESSETASSAASTASSEGAITLSMYNAISIGMTYEEVAAVFGTDGIAATDSTAGARNHQSYMWTGGDLYAMAVIDFENGVVVSKAQFGLK